MHMRRHASKEVTLASLLMQLSQLNCLFFFCVCFPPATASTSASVFDDDIDVDTVDDYYFEDNLNNVPDDDLSIAAYPQDPPFSENDEHSSSSDFDDENEDFYEEMTDMFYALDETSAGFDTTANNIAPFDGLAGIEEIVSNLDGSENTADNDYQKVTRTNMRIGISGIFLVNTVNGTNSFFGMITRVDRDNYTIQKYGIETFDLAISSRYFCSYRSPLFYQFLTTLDNNLFMKSIEETEFFKENIQLTQPFYMHSKFHPTGYAERRLLNVHKFGSLWSNMNICSQ
ncbi:hypothetical protein F4703DRAFT_1945863 [Phycomyces blakesleeanus]